MLKSHMLNKINIYIFYILLSLCLDAKEPTLAILNNTISNAVQEFGIGSYSFECKPYGILTLDSIYNSSKPESKCQENINTLYRKNPKLKDFTHRLLKHKQRYHLEIKETECILYAKGQVTLSELLLLEGLAMTKPIFEDEEFSNYFILAEEKAKMQNKGLWGEKIFNSCIKNMYK